MENTLNSAGKELHLHSVGHAYVNPLPLFLIVMTSWKDHAPWSINLASINVQIKHIFLKDLDRVLSKIKHHKAFSCLSCAKKIMMVHLLINQLSLLVYHISAARQFKVLCVIKNLSHFYHISWIQQWNSQTLNSSVSSTMMIDEPSTIIQYYEQSSKNCITLWLGYSLSLLYCIDVFSEHYIFFSFLDIPF